ncbi:MAG TPA: TraR/DksA family transcriptional regulator [Anaeromyxobacteraceae bacterium]|nr:TraR/DksA family transcriptional regulator [Anaeromyxobacteraceae bacterium]
MRREVLDAARARLERRRAELVALIRDGNAGISQIRSEREIEFGDEAQSEEEQERIARVGEVESAELTRVEAALARVEAGTWGICATCGEAIEPRRLEASPWAVLCAGCAGAGPRH